MKAERRRAWMGFRSSGRHLDRFETVAFREAAAESGLGRRRARQREPPAPFVGAARRPGCPGAAKRRGTGRKRPVLRSLLSTRSFVVKRGSRPTASAGRMARSSPGIPVLVLERSAKVGQAKRGPCVGDSRAAAGRHARAWHTRPGGPRFSCKARARVNSSRDVLVGRVGLQKSSGVADGPEKRSTSSS